MSDQGGGHEKINADAIDEKILGGVIRLKAQMKKLLGEMTTLNALQPDSVPARYFQYYEEMAAKLDQVDQQKNINARQLALWTDEIQQTGYAVVRYLHLDPKLRPGPAGLTVVDGGKR